MAGRAPFNKNFRNFRSKPQWIGSVQQEKFRKNRSTFEVDTSRLDPTLFPGLFPSTPRTNSPEILAPYVFFAVYRGVKWSTWRVRTDCEHSLFSSKTVGEKQNKCGSVPVLPAARLHVTLTVTLTRLLVLRSSHPHGFSRKRKTARSVPGGVRDEQKGLGFTGREGGKISLL